MGQAFDRDGRQLAEAFGNTKAEVFDRLKEAAPDAAEIRIRSIEQKIEQLTAPMTEESPSSPDGYCDNVPMSKRHNTISHRRRSNAG